MTNKIQGVSQSRVHTDYQYFPSDYFSGADTILYFDDIYVDDVLNLEFGLTEKVMPVYGYNSNRYDAVGRGQRLVQGSFTIAFKEAGYMYQIMDHIGSLKEKAKPMLSYRLSNQAVPKWVAGAMQTMENYLDGVSSYGTEPQTVASAPKWKDMSLGSTGADVKALQQFIANESNKGRYKGVVATTGGAVKPTLKRGSKGKEVLVLKARLNYYLYDSGVKFISTKLNQGSSTFDAATEAAVRVFQKSFSKTLAADGIVGEKTAFALNRSYNFDGTFDAPTKLSVLKFQKANGLTADGVVGEKTRSKLTISVTVKDAKKERGNAESYFDDYEASIWGDQSKYDTSFQSNPYFYGSEKQREWLQKEGFDIYINYGQLPMSISSSGSISDKVSFNNTVRAIRGVQLTGVAQVINPDGVPIAERYSFIAKDLD